MKKLIVMTIVEGVLILNAWLTAKGINPIPLDESEITAIASYIVGLAAVIHTGWKNHNFTSAAREGQRIVDWIKAGIIDEFEYVGGETSNEFEPADPTEEEIEVGVD